LPTEFLMLDAMGVVPGWRVFGVSPAIRIIDTVSVSAVKVFACQVISNDDPGVNC